MTDGEDRVVNSELHRFCCLSCSFVGFDARTEAEHRRRAEEYQNLNGSDRDTFFKVHATRYTEFLRLRYFNPIRMTIIDPMHNILLGKSICYYMIV